MRNLTLQPHIEQLPKDFFIDVIKGLPEVYNFAWNHIADSLDRPFAINVYPHLRREYVDEFLKKKAKQHNLEYRIKKNKAKNCSHLRILTGNIVITASAVDYNEQIIRKAEFRKTLAEYNEPSLFDIRRERPGDYFYLLLLHGSIKEDPARVGFINLALPNKDCKSYLDNINLEMYFKHKLYNETHAEHIDDNAIVSLKPRIQKKEG